MTFISSFISAAGGGAAHVLTPAAGAALCTMTRHPRAARIVSGLCLAASAAAALTTCAHFAGGGENTIAIFGTGGGTFILSGAASLIAALSAFTALTAWAAGGTALSAGRNAALLLAHAGAAGAALSQDLFTGGLFLLLQAFCVSALAAAGARNTSAASAQDALLTWCAGTTLTLFGAGLLYTVAGATDLGAVHTVFQNLPAGAMAPAAGIAVAAAGLWLRTGAPPAHPGPVGCAAEAPRGMEAQAAFSAPALLCLWKLMYVPGDPAAFADAAAFFGAVAACWGAAAAAAQRELRKAFAYLGASAGGSALALAGQGQGDPESLRAAFAWLTHSALTLGALFAAARALHLRCGGSRLADARAAMARAPVAALLMTAALAAWAGLPCFTGAPLLGEALRQWQAGRPLTAAATAFPLAGAVAVAARLFPVMRPGTAYRGGLTERRPGGGAIAEAMAAFILASEIALTLWNDSLTHVTQAAADSFF